MRPLARVSNAATSLRYHSTAVVILESALEYSVRAPSDESSCCEPGTKDTVDLTLDFEAYVRDENVSEEWRHGGEVSRGALERA